MVQHVHEQLRNPVKHLEVLTTASSARLFEPLLQHDAMFSLQPRRYCGCWHRAALASLTKDGVSMEFCLCIKQFWENREYGGTCRSTWSVHNQMSSFSLQRYEHGGCLQHRDRGKWAPRRKQTRCTLQVASPASAEG
jgi:hypothetical protein